MYKKLKILRIGFNQELSFSEIGKFRGAVIDKISENDVLFHNHVGEGFRYSYPLIQYKRIGGRAAVVCVGEGTESIGKFFASENFELMIGDRQVRMEVENMSAKHFLVQLWDGIFSYHLRKWLPLNSENYEKYTALDSVVEKYAMLEKILTGNVLSFAKGVGVHFEQQVVCKIVSVEEPRPLLYKGVKMMAFDLEFKTNVSLPDYIGLGKGVSLGFGTVVRKYEKKNDNNKE